AGLFDLGENRVEALAEKVPALADERVRWHMIGHLQRRKAPQLVGLPWLVHSLDTVRLGERLDRVAREHGTRFRVLVQVNAAGEATKSGFAPAEVPGAVERLRALDGLELCGLMTMAPFTDDEALLRRTFACVRALHERLREEGAYEGTVLSMGMTNDFEPAIEEGSTMVRLGTALFGERTG
ncbi:MAG: YggS family pyridoxal phosphate-dependent enzyme, partial [Gemmatimonadetes bacterium]